jgi:uncharacterized protein (DUF362 family)
VSDGNRSRRQFLTETTLATAGLSLSGCFPDVDGNWPVECDFDQGEGLTPVVGPSRVVEVHDPASVTLPPEITIQADRVVSMMGETLFRLAGSWSTPRPWLRLLPDYVTGMRVGIKVNCLNPYCPTSVPVIRALVDSLKADLGIPVEEIIVWDRRLDELEGVGVTSAAVGATVMGTESSTTDRSGPGYGDCVCEVTAGKRTRLSRILTDLTDVTIGCPVLKTHEVSGITASMKNVYGVIDNPGDFHADLNTALPALYALEPIRTRFRLHVLDALVAVTVGGTASPVDTIGHRLLAGQDPVALDSYALDLVNRLRTEKGVGLPQVSSGGLAWLDEAHAIGLGARAYEPIAVSL